MLRRVIRALGKMPSEQSPEGGRGAPKAHGQRSWCVQGTPRKRVLPGQMRQKGNETRALIGPNVGGLVGLAVVQSLSCVQLFVTPWTAARQSSLSFTISQSLLKLMSIEWVIQTQPSHPLSPLLLLPSIIPSIRVFSNESVLHFRWSKYCSFSTSPSSEYSELISFRINCFDLLAVQGTLNSLL